MTEHDAELEIEDRQRLERVLWRAIRVPTTLREQVDALQQDDDTRHLLRMISVRRALVEVQMHKVTQLRKRLAVEMRIMDEADDSAGYGALDQATVTSLLTDPRLEKRRAELEKEAGIEDA